MKKIFVVIGVILLIYALFKALIFIVFLSNQKEFTNPIFDGYGQLVDIIVASLAAWLSFKRNKWGLILAGLLLAHIVTASFILI